MNLIVVRHTSVSVPPGTCYGQTDIPLSVNFTIEFERIREKLQEYNYCAVYSSPLTRCSLLAEHLSNGLPVILDERLSELNFGKWEGGAWDQISGSSEAQKWFCNWLYEPCPGGESYDQLITRVARFVQSIRPIGRDVLLVTHGGVIRALLHLLTNITPQKAFDIRIEYGEILKLNLNE